MRAVSFDGMQMLASAIFAICPPVSPVRATVNAPVRLAASSAAQTFLLFPEVEMPTTTSPAEQELPPGAEIPFHTRSRFRSPSRIDVSVVNAIEGRPRRSRLKRPISSAAKMLRVSGATAISAPQYFVPIENGAAQFAGNPLQYRLLGKYAFNHGNMFVIAL